MAKEKPILLLMVMVASSYHCHGYAIKEPGAYTASFSKSSSSASAYSHSSSSSYTFGGDLSPTAVEGIHDALKAGAVAHASAGAVAGSEATAGAVATASASAHAGAAAPSAVAASGAVAGSSVEGDVKSGNAATDSNAISESGVDDGSYKKIASDKYTTNYSSGDQTNYAVSGEYVQPQQNSVGGCTTCKGPFPGPNGSIHDYKPAPAGQSGATSGATAHQQQSGATIHGSNTYSGNKVSSGQYSTSGHVSPSLIATLPGSSGSIYDSKPAGAVVAGASASAVAGASASSGTQSYQVPTVPSPCSGSGCGSTYQATPGLANIIPVLPGPSGSIYDSKPASAGHSSAGESSSTSHNSGSTHVQSIQPVPAVTESQPHYAGGSSSTSYNSGSTNVESSQPSVIVPLVPVVTESQPNYVGGSSSTSYNSGSTNVASSQPSVIVPLVPVVTESQPNYVSGSSSTSYNSGLTNIQSVQPEVVPVVTESQPNYVTSEPLFPGSTGSINSYEPAPTLATDLIGITSSGGSSSSSSTSESNTADSSSTSYNSVLTNVQSLQPVVVPVVKPIFPGPTGSINSYKPAPTLPTDLTGTSNSGFSSSSSETTVLNTSGSSSSYNSGSALQPVPVPIVPETQSNYVTAKPIFPGPIGSIHSYKPAPSSSSSSATTVLNTSGSSTSYNSGSTVQPVAVPETQPNYAYSGAGSVTNIPASHPAAGPACSYSPGSGQKCGSSASQTNQVNTESGSSTSNQYESAYSGAGSVTNIPASHPVVGPACSYAPGSGQNCGSSGITHTNVDSGATSSSQQESGTSILVPSVHPEIPQPGTYYINKPSQPSKEVEAPFANSPSFSGQIPCSDSNCGESQKIPAPSSGSAGCGSGTSCGGSAVSSGSFSSAHSSDNSAVVYNTKDTTGQHSGINHDQAHLSGGLVFQNDDGSYSHNPVVTKPNYKNSDKGGYAVSTNQDDNTGVLLGPGTGHLPIEAGHSKPFGTQGAFGGSVQFSKGADNQYGTEDASGGATTGVTIDKEGAFGTQGAFGGSSSFSSAASQSSAHTITNTGQGTTQFTVEKVDGTEVTPVQPKYPEKSSCLSGACGSDNNAFPSRPSYPNTGIPIKLPCYGKSCGGGNTQVYIVEEKEGPSYPQYGNGYNHLHRYYGGSGVNGGSGYATGQVLINQGPHTYDYTNHNTGFKGSNYAGSYGGHYPSPIYPSPHPMGYFYGCKSGRCGGQGLHSLPLGLFNVQKFGGGAVSGAYSNSGSGGGASAGSFASATAGASASASAGSYARSY